MFQALVTCGPLGPELRHPQSPAVCQLGPRWTWTWLSLRRHGSSSRPWIAEPHGRMMMETREWGKQSGGIFFRLFYFFTYRMTVGVHHLVVSLVLIFPSLKLNDEQSIKILMSKTWLCSQCSVWSFRSYMVWYAVHWLLLYNMICNIIPFVNCNIIPIIGISSMDLSASETVKSTFLIIKWYWRMNQSFFWHMTFVIVLFWYQNQCHSVTGLWRVFCL